MRSGIDFGSYAYIKRLLVLRQCKHVVAVGGNVVSRAQKSHGFTLYGAGWGHGVGLCQIGAAVMSEPERKM
mgnify:CR=1 FL=1